MPRPKQIVTKAELAAVLNLTPGRISQLSKRKDFPQRPDGRIDRERAVQWYHEDAGLGNRATKRGPKPASIKTLEIVERIGANAAYPAVLDALRRIVAPAEVLKFARVILRLGCTAEQAYVVASWFACQPCLTLTEVDADDLGDFTEPTRKEWVRLLGVDFDFDAADATHDAATLIETSPAEEQI